MEPSRWWTFRREVGSPLLQPLLAAVGAMVLLHVLEAGGMVDTSDSSLSFSLAVDRGLGEVLGYLITAAIVVGFVSLGRRAGHDRLLYAAAGLFTYALADDLFMIHERTAATISGLIGEEFGPLVDVGYFVIVAGLVIAGGRAIVRGASPTSRFIARWTSGFLVAFGVLSVGGQVLVDWAAPGPAGVTSALVVISDGGELAVLAVLASFVLGQLRVEQASAVDNAARVLDRAIIDLRRDGSSRSDTRLESSRRR